MNIFDFIMYHSYINMKLTSKLVKFWYEKGGTIVSLKKYYLQKFENKWT
jgi:hypothetical protein